MPTNPTNVTAPTISYSDAQQGVTFACTLDGTAKTCNGTNGSGTTSGSVILSTPAGSHTFSITASSGGKTSAVTSYTWTVDTTAPTVSAPVLASGSPTNAASVSWTVIFSEPVKNVAAANFQLAPSNLTGSSITGISGSGASYTVTATTGSLTNSSLNGSLGLNMVNKGSGATAITDVAGNPLSTTVPQTGAVYTIDRVAPPAPSITGGPSGAVASNSATFTFSSNDTGPSTDTFLCKLDTGSYAGCASPVTFAGLADGSHTLSVEAKDAAGNVSATAASRSWTVDTTPPPKPTVVGPNNNNSSTAATFTFSDTEANVTWKCQLDGGGYTPCSSPKTYTLLPPGTHVFDVEPIDQVGNVGAFNEWKWTISGLSGSGMNFSVSISNGPLPALYPGGTADKIDLKLSNPNTLPVYVTSLTVALSSVVKSTSAPANLPCGTGDFTITQLGAGANLSSNPIMIPAQGSTTLSAAGLNSYLPTISMKDRHDVHPGDGSGNQDGCENATLNFSFGGSAQS